MDTAPAEAMRFPVPILGICLLFPVLPGAQEAAPPDPASARGTGIVEALSSIRDSIRALENEMGPIARDLETPGRPDREALENRWKDLSRRRDELRADFDSMATGIEPGAYDPTPQSAFDLRRELEDLIRPVVDEIKSVTKGSREIEQLRSELAVWESRRRTAADGLTHLNLLPPPGDEDLAAEIAATRSRWEDRLLLAENRVRVLHYQLDEAEKDSPSFYEAARDGIRDFLRTRGLNLLLCLLAFAFTFFLLRALHRWLERSISWMHGPARPFHARLLDVILHVVSVAGAMGALLFVLYAAGDWVLMGLAVIVLIGVVFAARTAVPKLLKDARVLLNLGEIREGERVIYRGLPWRVASLGFQTVLSNDSLRGGVQKLPVRRLSGLVSRPLVEGELWFPTEEGDWVDLPGRGIWRVVSQTIEWVHLVQLGGARLTLPVLEFLENGQKNLSHGFRISTRFRLGYRHREEAPTTIPGLLEDHVEAGLTKLLGGGESIGRVRVELAEAGPDSLDFALLADFDGAAAGRHEELGRALQSLAVECSNEHGWDLPLPRLELHRADAAGA